MELSNKKFWRGKKIEKKKKKGVCNAAGDGEAKKQMMERQETKHGRNTLDHKLEIWPLKQVLGAV